MSLKFIFLENTGNTVLFRVPCIAKILIPSSVKEIYGINAYDYAFRDARHTAEEVTFPDDNNLEKISDYAFCACQSLKTVDLSNCLKLSTIGSHTFQSSTLQHIYLPESKLTSIGEYSFDDCKQLQSFHFPNSILNFGARLLSGCDVITNITFGTECQVETITWGAFYYCKILKSIKFPSKVTTIDNILSGCNEMENIYVDERNENLISIDGVVYTKNPRDGLKSFPLGRTGNYTVLPGTKRICMCAFMSSLITSISFPDTLELVEDWAFCSAHIESLTIPPSLKHMQYRSFAATNISEVVFPEVMNVIGDECFTSCKKLIKVTLPKTFNYIGSAAFTDCHKDIQLISDPNSDYQVKDQRLVYDKTLTKIVLYVGAFEKVTINDKITEIGSSVFYLNKNLKTLEFAPNSNLNIIGASAFRECSIETLTLPDSIERIRPRAFYRSKIKSITFGSSLKLIEENAFRECPNLETVNFKGDGNCEIYEFAFSFCDVLANVDFANAVKTLGNHSFGWCPKLTSINLPRNIMCIGVGCFRLSSVETFIIDKDSQIKELPSNLFVDCNNVKKVEIPNSIQTFGTYCFSGIQIENVTIPASVKNISEYCFKDCKKMVNFIIPEGSVLERIKYGTFIGCENFANITCYSSSFKIISGSLYTADEKRLIVVPPKVPIKFFAFSDKLQIVGENALLGCVYINCILIPSKSVEIIENNAFEGCTSLEIINIPECVKTIGPAAFKRCPKLKCGLLIENRTEEFINNLVTVSNLPKLCLKDCEILINCRTVIHMPITFLLAGFMLFE